jgi:hypothetical protein
MDFYHAVLYPALASINVGLALVYAVIAIVMIPFVYEGYVSSKQPSGRTRGVSMAVLVALLAVMSLYAPQDWAAEARAGMLFVGSWLGGYVIGCIRQRLAQTK